MAAAHPLPLPADAAQEAWIEQQLAAMDSGDRARFAADESFRALVRAELEHELSHPELRARYRDDGLRASVEDFVAWKLEGRPAEDAAKLADLRARLYGADCAREMAAIQDGTHPAHEL